MFRSKKLDLGCFVNIKVIRDHTKRKVFAENEPERYAPFSIMFSLKNLLRACPIPSIHLFCAAGNILIALRDRQALRYIIRNLILPARTRAQAQLQLSQMHCYTRSTQIRNRCIEGGKGRGVLRDFKMSRVCRMDLHESPGMPVTFAFMITDSLYI